MNKLFLLCLAFAMTVVAYGQPTESFDLEALAKLSKEQRECAVNRFIQNKLAGLKAGEVTDVRDCASGCFKYLAATITTCLYSVVNWAAVPYCVQHAIGAGDQCFDCVCEAVEWMCNCDVC